MTVRTAEIITAIICALCSIGIMIKSAELNIGWVPNKGPGSGAWPFWLAAGMLGACIATIYRWFTGATPESRNTDPFITRDRLLVVATSAGCLLFFLIAIHLVGMYAALLLFLLIYLKFVGRHSWLLTIILMIAVPVGVFMLFEWALKIPLPKAWTEPMFYPIYDLMYS